MLMVTSNTPLALLLNSVFAQLLVFNNGLLGLPATVTTEINPEATKFFSTQPMEVLLAMPTPTTLWIKFALLLPHQLAQSSTLNVLTQANVTMETCVLSTNVSSIQGASTDATGAKT